MNRLKEKEEPQSTKKPASKGAGAAGAGSKVARSVLNVLNGNFLSKEAAIKHVSFLFFLAFILIAYTAYGYFAEKTVKDLNKVTKQLDEMDAEETTVKTNLSRLKRQSQVAASAKPLGVFESLNPPTKVEVSKDELDLK